MIDDIRLAIECSRPVSLVNRMGGNLVTVDDVVRHVRKLAKGGN
jgi:2-oxoisovalerate ferredoxin oxidoreductase alpha subunit